MKYTAFIDSLIENLRGSELCSNVFQIRPSPIGYADDLAASTVSKHRMDGVMKIVHKHGCDWRYNFNAGKSAVLVFGETKGERRIGSNNRMFSLGGKRVKERLYYDHVGIKTCVDGDTHIRTDEKVSKARRVLNMSTNIGIRKGGLNLNTCNVIFWTVVMPTLLYGCEVWFLKYKDIELLQSFQRYAARRLQRLHYRSLNATSVACLGWMDVVTIIKVRKIIFLRTIFVMAEYMPIKVMLLATLQEQPEKDDNPYDSAILQMIGYCGELGLLPEVRGMAGGIVPSKALWKRSVWERAWYMEQGLWDDIVANSQYLDLVNLVTDQKVYSIWWQIADKDQGYMRRCETMVKLLCHASLLKADDSRLRRSTFIMKCCTLCDHASYENLKHVVMQCPYHIDRRTQMYDELNIVCPNMEQLIDFNVLIGKCIAGMDIEEMFPIWAISCTYITKMYHDTLNNRS